MEKKVDPSNSARIELESLIQTFYRDVSELAQFTEVDASEIPEPHRSLLNHDQHMTVTVEKFHSSPVDVHVLNTNIDENHYAREIVLKRQTDGRVVQYGIVRLNFAFLDDEVRQEIESQKTPLGRILINHNVLRRVQLLSLYRIAPDPAISNALDLKEGDECFGRTALIYVNDQPAVELLEIVMN